MAEPKSRLPAIAFGLAGLVIVLDQAIKHQVLLLGLAPGQSRPLIGPFHLTMVWNQGVSFGLLQANHDLGRWVLTGFAFVMAGLFAWWARTVKRPLLGLCYGLVIGGAIGNAVDRIRLGAVVDFFDATALMFPWVFNLADSAIVVGMGFLLLDSLQKQPAQADG